MSCVAVDVVIIYNRQIADAAQLLSRAYLLISAALPVATCAGKMLGDVLMT